MGPFLTIKVTINYKFKTKHDYNSYNIMINHKLEVKKKKLKYQITDTDNA